MSAIEQTTARAPSLRFGERVPAFLKMIALALLGNVGLFYINTGFDYGLYPYVALQAEKYFGFSVESGLATLAVMTPLSAILSWVIIKGLDWTGQDWLGLEELKKARDETVVVKRPRRFHRFLHLISLEKLPRRYRWLYPLIWVTDFCSYCTGVIFWTLRWLVYPIKLAYVWMAKSWIGDVVAFAIFSFYDPVYAALYIRKTEHQYKGFTRRDWYVFFGSVLTANVIWTPGVVLAVGFAPWLLDFASGYFAQASELLHIYK